MKILNAIGFQEQIDKGGSTYPWIVLVEDEGELVPYVVKLFKERQINQQCAVAKEAFGNILAVEFGLPVPDFSFIHFSKEFIETLPADIQNKYVKVDKRIKFGSKYMDGYAIFDSNNYAREVTDYETMTSIFAFDNLVWNLDRGGMRNKPNLLIRDNEFLLIDHEQILVFADDAEQENRKIIDDFNKGVWTYPHDKHLFYSILKKTNKKFKENWLDTFEEYLRRLNPNKLEPCKKFLHDNGHPTGNFALLKEYLCTVRDNASKFLDAVNSLIL